MVLMAQGDRRKKLTTCFAAGGKEEYCWCNRGDSSFISEILFFMYDLRLLKLISFNNIATLDKVEL